MSSDPIGPARVRESARSLAAGFGIEVTPRETDQLPAVSDVLAPGTPVYVTYLSTVPFERMLTTAERIRRAGLRPVVHVAARAVADLATMDRMLGRLADHGVTDLLLIAGSIDRPAGSIDDTLRVLESGLLQRRAFAGIGVAGHPEGNPVAPPGAADDALLRKNKIAAGTGLPLYVVTQFCFAAAPIVDWERRMRDAGNELPVHVGLPGLTSPARLVRFGLSCGVGPSLAVLRKRAGGVLRLATRTYRPTDVVTGVARAAASDVDSRFAAFHFFPFGAVVPTARWAGALARGDADLADPDDPGSAASDVDR